MLTDRQRRNLARALQAKGDRDTSQWLPPNAAAHCAYVARQIAVKSQYRLWLTPAEKDAMRGVLTGCPDETLPIEDSPQVRIPPLSG